MQKPHRNAFTLIELLIVVAIIAVLAAIAVPNFLEAQIRAKVGRAVADLRTLAMAVETYRLDSGSLPGGWREGLKVYDLEGRLSVLTTPVSYMAALPRDVFPPHYNNGALVVNLSEETGGPYYCYGRSDQAGLRGTIDLGRRHMMLASAGPDGLLEQVHYYPPGPESRSGSNCPMCGPEMQSVLGVTVYDPTNGSRSRGDLYRWDAMGHDR